MRGNIKQEILETARLLFNEKGFKATTMREIADRMGISLGNLTYHYHKKEDMMVEMVQRPDFLDKEIAQSFTEFFQLIQAMVDSLIVNRFFYTADELFHSSDTFSASNTNNIQQIETHLEKSLQNLSDQNLLVPWISNEERHAFTHVIMSAHLIWIKNSFYLINTELFDYHEFLAMHWYLLESHVESMHQKEYKDCLKKLSKVTKYQ